MSIKIMSKVWEQSSHEGSPLLLLLALADHASDDGVCWPGIPRLAHKTRKTERHTKRLLVKLEESGEVYIAREVGRGNTNMYYITLGFDEEEMVHTLIKRFEFEPDEASEIAQQIVKRQIKGDAQDTFSGDGEDEKGDIQGQEKVTPGAEKVTSRDGKGDTAMSPESPLTVIEPSEENHQKDADFSETFPKTPVPPAPSPGGDPDPGKEIDDEGDDSPLHGHDSGNSSMGDSTFQHPDGIRASGDAPVRIRDGMDMEADPLLMSFERRTAAARAEAGNWADPAQAGGDDAVAEAGLVALHKAKGGSAPRKGTGTYDKEIGAIRQALSDRDVTDPRVAVKAAQMFVEEKPKLACPHYKSFVGDYGEYLGRAHAQAAKPDRRARTVAHAEASQAALQQRRAEAEAEAQDRGPPTAWDKIVGELTASPSFNAPRFGPYLEDTCQVEQEDGVLRVAVPTEEARAILEDYLRQPAERMAVGVLGRVEVRFEVVE